MEENENQSVEAAVYEINTLQEIDLSTTVKYMTSPDYKIRFIAEYLQVKIRYNKLKNVLLKDEVDELDFELSCGRDVLEDQLYSMREYIDSLQKRAILEAIPLPRI